MVTPSVQTTIKHKRRWIVLSIFFVTLVLMCLGFAIYVSSYYRADEDAVQAMSVVDDISVTPLKCHKIQWICNPAKSLQRLRANP